jgi:hypothetical protein
VRRNGRSIAGSKITISTGLRTCYSSARLVSHWMGRPLPMPSPTPPLVATTRSGRLLLRWNGTSLVARPAALSTPGVLLPWHFSWRSTTPLLGLTRHASAPRTPPKPSYAPVAPHSALPSTSSWSAVSSSNTDSTAAYSSSTAPFVTPSCMCRSRTPTASSPFYSPVTWPSGLKPVH